MANQTGSPAGTSGMSAMNNTALLDNGEIIGHIEPLIGRIARNDVIGYFGFPLIKKGRPSPTPSPSAPRAWLGFSN